MINTQGSTGSMQVHRGGCILPNQGREMLFEDGTGISCRDGTTTIHGSGKNDNIHAHVNYDGSVDVNINGKTLHFTAQEARNLKIEGGDGNDNIQITGHQLFGADTNITIDGGNGNDIIRGGAGDETITGGYGDDWIDGGAGNDEIDGGFGNDTLIGGCGDDKLNGGAGDDDLWGGSGNDDLHGGFGDDNLIGGSGNDWMAGDYGRDNYWGGAGSDVLKLGSSDGVIDMGGDKGDFGIETDVDDRCYILTGQERTQPSENRDGGDGKCNPFDPLGLFGGGFPLNMISPK
jgi:Ca2+-binding RTX toxin-like protein